MVGNKPNGKGTTVFKNGDTYEGSYVKGKRNGYGVYTFADGEKYEGQWMEDQQHGRGTYYFQNNNKYVVCSIGISIGTTSLSLVHIPVTIIFILIVIIQRSVEERHEEWTGIL